MANKTIRNSNFIIYHYELTNDGRWILMLEPNIFIDYQTAELHKSCLEFLSGSSYTIIPECDLSHLDFFLDDVKAR